MKNPRISPRTLIRKSLLLLWSIEAALETFRTSRRLSCSVLDSSFRPKRRFDSLARASVAFVSLFAMLSGQVAWAATSTWKNVGADWNTLADWNTTIPTSASIADFNVATTTSPTFNGTGISVGAIWLTGGAGSTTITNSATSTVNLYGGQTINSTSNVGIWIDNSLNATLTLGATTTTQWTGTVQASQEWYVGTGDSLTLNGGSSSGSVNLNGFTVTLAGSGTINLGRVNNSGTGDTSGTIIMNGSGLLSNTGGFGGSITQLQLNSGTTELSSNWNSVKVAATAGIDFTGNAALNLNTAGDMSGDILINDGITATFNTDTANQTFATGFQLGTNKTASIVKTGAFTLILSGVNSYTGSTTITQGTLQLANTTANNGGLGSGTLNLNGGTLQATSVASLALTNAVSLTAASTVSGAQNLTFNGVFTQTGASSTLTSSISSANSLTLGNVYLSNSSGSGYTLTLAGTGDTSVGAISNYSGIGGTAGNLSISNSGVTTLTSADTYTGTTAVSAGVVVLDNASAFGSGAVTIGGGAILNASTGNFSLNNAATGLASSTYYLGGAGATGGFTFSNAVTQSAGSTYNVNGGNTLTFGAFNLNANSATFNGPGNVTIGGNITNGTASGTTNALIHTGIGTLTLSGPNTFVGQTQLQSTVAQSGLGLAGSVIAIGASPFGAAGNTITWNGGSGGNAQWEPITFQADSSASPVSYSFADGNNNAATAFLTLDTQNISAGYSRSFTFGNGTTTGVFSNKTNFIVQQGPTATSAMTFNETGNDYTASSGGYLVPLMNTAGTFGVAMNIASASIPSVSGTAGTVAIGLDGNTTGNTLGGTLNNNSGGSALDSLAITKTNTSTWTLTGAAGTMSGGITIGGGTLNITGALGAGLNALTFNGSGTINFNEAAGSTQNMGVLTASAGDAVIQSTYAGSGASTLTFSNAAAINLASSVVGATMNFVASDGVNNKIILTQNGGAATTTNAFVGGNAVTAGNATVGDYFGGGNYAFYDTAGYVRGVNWSGTPDANTVLSSGGVSLSTLSLTASKLLELTGNASNSSNTIVAGILLSGNISLSMTSQLQAFGLLENGGSSTISGSDINSAATGGEYFFRANQASDVLDIQSPIFANGTNGLTTSGAGTVKLDSSASTATYGFVTVGGGKLQLAGSSGLGTNYQLASAGVGGGTQTLSILGTGMLDLDGNSISTKTTNLATGATIDNSSTTPVILDIGNGGGASILSGAITNSGGGPLTIVQLSTGTTTLGSAQGAPYGYDATPNTFSGGYYYKGSNNGAGGLNINSNTAFGTGPVWLGDAGTGAPYVSINENYGAATTLTNNNTFYLQQDLEFGASNPLNLGAGTFNLVGNRTIYNTSGSLQSPLTIGGQITDGSATYGLTFYGGQNGGSAANAFLPSGTGWVPNPTMPYYGTGAQLILDGNNTFKGGLTIGEGSVTTNANSGTPFGVGNININGAGNTSNPIGNSAIVVEPLGSGNASLSAVTASGATLNYSGLAYVDLYNQSGGTLTLTLGSSSNTGSVLTRSGNGELVIDDQTALANLGGIDFLKVASASTAPTVTNGMVLPTIIGATNNTANGTFLTYNSASGFVPVSYDITGTSFTGSTATTKVAINGTTTVASSASAYALQVGGTITINSGQTLTIGDGINPAGVIINSGGITGADSTSILAFGNSEGIIDSVNANPTISATITGANGVTYTAANTNGTLTLTRNPGWTGALTINSGAVKFATGSSFTMPGTIQGAGQVNFANTGGTITLAQGAGTHYLNNGFTVGAGTANVVFAGAGSINYLNAVGWGFTGTPTLAFSSGTWYMNGTGNAGTNVPGTFTVNGAYVQIEGGRYWQSAGGTTNVSSGTLAFGGDRLDPGEQLGSTTITFNISGTGLLDVLLNQYGALLGALASNSSTFTLNQTGGTFQSGVDLNTTSNSSAGGGNIIIGIAGKTSSVATYNLSAGTVRAAGTISSSGAPGGGSSNNFNFTGGTLTVGAYAAANLTSNDGVSAAAAGTLFQSGKNAVSNLAPGDYWTPTSSVGSSPQYGGLFSGKTTITGNYQADASTNAANIVINLSGPTQAGVFHDAGIGKYDFVSISGATNFNGAANLLLNPLPGFIMGTSNTLNVLTSTGAVAAGVLANVARAGTITVGDVTFTVNYPNAAAGSVAVTVANAAAINQWKAVSGSNWALNTDWSNGAITPGVTNTYTARFADAPVATGAQTVNLNASETVNGLAFDSSTRSYTISSGNSSSLTLDATGYTTNGTGLTGLPAAINDVSAAGSSNTVSVPIALNSDVYINEANNTLNLNGALTQGTGAAHNVSVYGAGLVTLAGAETFTGALNINTSSAGKGVELNSGASLGTTPGTNGPSAINFNGANNTLLVNTGANITIAQPITVDVSLLNGVYSNGNNPTGTAYIGTQSVVTSLGANNTATFSGGINLIGYSTLNVQPNDSSSGATYVFSGDVSNSLYNLDNSGVLNGTSGAGLTLAQTNGVVVKFTGNIGWAGSLIGTGANGASTGSASALNFYMNTKGGTTWVGNSAGGSTVNLYNLYFNPTATGSTITTTTPSNELVLNGDITAYALYSSGVASNSLNQIVGNATGPAFNTLNVVGSQNMSFTGVIGGTGSNQNNIALNLKPGAPFTVTLNGIDSFTGGLTVGDGAVNVTTVGATPGVAATWTASNTSSVLTVPSTAGLVVGESVVVTSGAGTISTGAVISDILSSTTVGITGATTSTGATVTFGAGSGVGGAANTVTVGSTALNESGKLMINGGGQTTTVAGIFTAGTGTANEIVGAASSVSTLQVQPSGTDTYNGLLGGSYTNENNLALTMNGAGTLVLGGANTFGGPVIINQGTVSVGTLAASGAAQPLGENSTVTLAGSSPAAPGTLQYTGGTATLSQGVTVTTGRYGTISNTGGGVLTLPAISKNGAVLNLSGGKFVAAGAISGSSASSDLNIIGGATVGEIVANSYNGPTSISGGSTLLTGVTNALPTANGNSAVTLGAVGETNSTTNTLDLLGTSQTVASLSTAGSGVNQIISSNGNASTPAIGAGASSATGTLTVNYNGGTADTFSGSLGGSGGLNNFGLTKAGTGALALTSANTYTGPTLVSAGTLKLAAAGTGPGANGGTLGNTAITVNSGGTLLLNASNAIGTNSTVNLNGDSLATTATFKDAGGFNEGSGQNATGATFNPATLQATGGTYSGNSNVQGMGNLTLSGNSTLDFNSGVETLVFGSFSSTNSGNMLSVINYTSTANILGGTSGTDGTDDRLIFDMAGGLSVAQLAEISFSGGKTAGEISLGGNYYEVGAIPEPSTVFAALALMGLVGYRERRRVSHLVRTLVASA